VSWWEAAGIKSVKVWKLGKRNQEIIQRLFFRLLEKIIATKTASEKNSAFRLFKPKPHRVKRLA
jgi:hypothetical protein